jgi:hypothetical protein
MFGAINSPFNNLIKFACASLVKDADINCESDPVHICTARCQALLRALIFIQQTAISFSNQITEMFGCSSCGQYLVQFATHYCPAASTVPCDLHVCKEELA